ncbi:MAG TPA: acetyl-CoA carboxylase biotin carboxyl carrier protein [Bryobacteraceae bacterium]|jgi:acetyl-CoA carboxylase biotin carboxyl carrier protein
MTIEEIKELLELFNESGIGEMELQRGKDRLRLRKAGEPVAMQFAPQAAAAAPVVDHSASAAAAPAKAAEPDSTQVLVKSPIVGTFYESSAPGSAPFVKIGDHVEPDTVMCIIESMKLMNEINAEVSGVVAAKLVENGRPVEYGEALFAIVPR